MDRNKYEIVRLSMERTAEALRKNNFYAVCAENKEEALEIIENLIDDGASVVVGGSMTLFEIGAIELLRSEKYNFFDRYEKGLTAAEITAVHKKAYDCDFYLCSTNAITENGELFNIDGVGNRVSAMIYGPRNVIVVAGYNKIVENIEEAQKRAKQISAPANAVRLSRSTPCVVTGVCTDCRSEERICSVSTVIGYQTMRERIKVVLVGEELGY